MTKRKTLNLPKLIEKYKEMLSWQGDKDLFAECIAKKDLTPFDDFAEEELGDYLAENLRDYPEAQDSFTASEMSIIFDSCADHIRTVLEAEAALINLCDILQKPAAKKIRTEAEPRLKSFLQEADLLHKRTLHDDDIPSVLTPVIMERKRIDVLREFDETRGVNTQLINAQGNTALAYIQLAGTHLYAARMLVAVRLIFLSENRGKIHSDGNESVLRHVQQEVAHSRVMTNYARYAFPDLVGATEHGNIPKLLLN